MRYEKITKGIFIDRPNRFIAHILINDKIETVHVKNTGRCKELLLPGCTVILEDFRNRKGFENRKTQFDLIAVYKKIDSSNPLFEKTGGNILINMDSQLPNKIVFEWLQGLSPEKAFSFIKPEYSYDKSRIDFYMERNDCSSGDRPQRYLMEVKGCTLESDGIGYFPDAPTERGVKHLNELIQASSQGFKCFLAFVIQIPGVTEVRPNAMTHPDFAKAFQKAQEAGVETLFLQCSIREDEVKIINI